MSEAPPPASEEPRPFVGLRISSHSPLESATSKTLCPTCRKLKRYYCCRCFVPLTPTPSVRLPLLVDIVHHVSEKLSKSTSVHARILSPSQVTLIHFPITEIPLYDADRTLLLYPCEASRPLGEVPLEELRRVERVVLVDSQWQKARSCLVDERLKRLKCVRIVGGRTAFWRYQSFGRDHLATVEALYYFCKEYRELVGGGEREGESLDDLLWYFSFFYGLIQRQYSQHPEKSFRHIEGYIRPSSDPDPPLP